MAKYITSAQKLIKGNEDLNRNEEVAKKNLKCMKSAALSTTKAVLLRTAGYVLGIF